MGAAVARMQGKYEVLARERHERDLKLTLRPGGHPRGLVWVPDAGNRVITFIELYCKHHKGEWAGQPLLLEDWQKEIIRQAFGWYNADGLRRFRTVYLEEPRKNGKSEIAGAIGLYLLIGDGEPGAEVYASATKKDQARIVWGVAAAMVRASPKLRKHVKSYRSSLHVERTDSKFEPLGADSDTLDGLNPHGNIIDELHAHKDRGVWDVLDTGMGARRQPMTLAITTAGMYSSEAIGWQQHDYAIKVLEGVFEDDSFYAVIFAADEGDDYFAEETQRKANPNFGVSVKSEYLSKQAEKAQRQASFLNEYLRLHLNVWTQQVTRWLSLDAWAKCEPELPSENLARHSADREDALEGCACRGGLDLASKLDLASLVLLFPLPGDGVAAVCRFWLPENTVNEYARKGARHYENWCRDGWITKTPGNVLDYEFIKRDILALATKYNIQEIAFDPWGATQLATQLQGEGVVMVEARQGFRTLSEPSKNLEALVVGGRVKHGGNPVLRFCVANAVVSSDASGNIKPDKEKAANKIDGVVALVMALSRVACAPSEEETSYLDRGDVVVLG